MRGHDRSAGITRRTAIRAGVWTVPVVAVTCAAPLAAASTARPAVQMLPVTIDRATFTWPGAVVGNPGTTPITVTWSVAVSPELDWMTGPTTGSTTVPPGSSATIAAGVQGFPVAAAWPTTLTLTLLRDGGSEDHSIVFQAEEA